MKLIGFFALIFGFFQCASVQFEQKPPFTVNGSSFNHYVGGMPGVSGTWVRVNYQATTKIAFDSLFFQGRKTKIQLETIKKNSYIKGRFNTSTVHSKEDLILHKEGKKEFGNKVPETKFPFELKDNQAVISYLVDGEKKYYKIENIKQTKSDYYP